MQREMVSVLAVAYLPASQAAPSSPRRLTRPEPSLKEKCQDLPRDTPGLGSLWGM